MAFTFGGKAPGKGLLGAMEEQEVEDRDRQAMATMAFEGAAVFANRFLITSHGSVVRISFGDQHRADTDPKFRAAVALNTYDAQQLVDILGSFLSDSPMGSENGEASEVPGYGPGR